jgi:cyclopropane fatty-acyl-phospholipid synthase-like methyltransferase
MGDVTRLEEVHGPFDLVLDIGCYHGISTPGKQAYRENLKRLLAPMGDFLMYSIFRQADEDRPGMLEEDIEAFFEDFELTQRQDGLDNRGRRSAWLIFRKKDPTNCAFDQNPQKT